MISRTTAIENVELPMIYNNTPSEERSRLAYEALSRVGLTGRETFEVVTGVGARAPWRINVVLQQHLEATPLPQGPPRRVHARPPCR